MDLTDKQKELMEYARHYFVKRANKMGIILSVEQTTAEIENGFVKVSTNLFCRYDFRSLNFYQEQDRNSLNG